VRNALGFKVGAFAVVTLILTIILAVAQEMLAIDYNYISLPQWGPGLAALLLGILYFKQSFNNVKLIGGMHHSAIGIDWCGILNQLGARVSSKHYH
jgi:hypothetical protein